jgi:hypothetical protein
MRFGYSAKNSSATDIGAKFENLFLAAIPDGIALKGKTPVTVYLVGVLTCRISLVYLLRQVRKIFPEKPPLARLNTSDKDPKVSLTLASPPGRCFCF